MTESRIKNVKRNMIWEFVNRIVSLLLPFISRTILIYTLGALYLGLNSLFGSILTILSLAELGFGSAMVFSMYEPIAKGRTDEVCALLNLYRKIYRYIGLCILGIGIVIMFFLPYIIKGNTPEGINIYVLYFIFLLGTSLSYFLFAYKSSLLIANQRNDINSNIGTVLSILTSIVQILVLITFKDYYLFCVVAPIVTILKNIYINYITIKLYPQYVCQGIISNEKRIDIKKRVAGLFVYKVCYVLRDSIDSITISAFLGLIVLAQFNNYFYIVSTITGLLVIIKTSLSASVGNSMVLESEEKNHKDFMKFQMLYMIISSWCTVCIYCLMQPFILLWVGEEYLLNNKIVLLFALLFYCYKMGDMCAVYRQAAGLWWQDKFRPIVEALTNLTLNILLIQIWGVAGVLLSTIFCLVFINSLWASRVLYRYYFKNYKQREYIVRILFFGCVTLLTMVITNYVCSLLPYQGGIGLMLKLCVCVVIPCPILMCVYALLPEYRISLSFLRSILKL